MFQSSININSAFFFPKDFNHWLWNVLHFCTNIIFYVNIVPPLANLAPTIYFGSFCH